MTLIDQVKNALYEGGSQELSELLTRDCLSYMQDRGITSKSYWGDQVSAINTQLRYWILEAAKKKHIDTRLDKKIHAARNSLSIPDKESYIEYWLADIKLDYAPVALLLF